MSFNKEEEQIEDFKSMQDQFEMMYKDFLRGDISAVGERLKYNLKEYFGKEVDQNRATEK